MLKNFFLLVTVNFIIYSTSELEDRIDKPSTPLRPIPEDEECPPAIVDYQENVTATEGIYFRVLPNVLITVQGIIIFFSYIHFH